MRRTFFHSIVVVAAVALTGCFTCVVPFYEEGQMVQDLRIEGTHDSLKDGRKDESIWVIEPTHERDERGNLHRKYDIFVRDGNVSVQLVGTLFRLDKTLFFDLYPVRDSGVRD